MNDENQRLVDLVRAHTSQQREQARRALAASPELASRAEKLSALLEQIELPDLAPPARGRQRVAELLHRGELVPRWVPATALTTGALLGALAFTWIDRVMPVPIPVDAQAIVEEALLPSMPPV